MQTAVLMNVESIGFEPFMKMACAIVSGIQVTPNEVFAYEQACDYYGKERVVVQEDSVLAENAPRRLDRIERIANTKNYVDRTIRDVSRSNMELFSLYPEVYTHIDTKNKLFIHWPDVTISNEEDKSIQVHDLFVRIPLYFKGLLFNEMEPFTVLKTTFSRVEWYHGYIHSHVQNYDTFRFRHMCLGSGPIKNTISKLKRHPTDEFATKLFFWELDKVMHVESIRGIPYIRMSSVVDDDAISVWNAYDYGGRALGSADTRKNRFLKDFLASFFRAVETPFVFRNGNYVLGCTFLEFCISITDYYNKWLCAYEDVRRHGVRMAKYSESTPLPRHIYALLDGKLYDRHSLRTRSRSHGSEHFKFGDRDFTLTVDEAQGVVYQEITLLEIGFVADVLNFMLAAINMAITQEYEQKEEKTAAQINYEQSRIFVSGEFVRERNGWATGSTSAVD